LSYRNIIRSAVSAKRYFAALTFVWLTTEALAQQGQQEETGGAAELEWVLREDLPSDLLTQCPRSCSGMYLEEQRSHAAMDINPGEADIEIVSNLSEVDGEAGIATMEGSVELIQGWRSVEAESIRILQDENRIEMDGGIRMREPGMLITGGSASIENSSQAMEFTDAEFVLHDLGVRGTADEVGRDAEGRFYVLNATYSTCEPGEDSWSLTASEIAIDQNQLFATAKNMVIRVGDVPIFYAPWFSFPVGEGRKTGLLYPRLSRSTENGLDVAQPIYLNLAPNRDMTVTPRYIEKRGVGLELETRFLGEHHFSQINMAYLPDDQVGSGGNGENKDRWLIGLDSQANLGWSESVISYNQVSDINYFDDLGSAAEHVNTDIHLRQFASLSRNSDSWLVTMSALRYQNLSDDLLETYRELPNFSLDGDFQTADFNWQLNHQLVNFGHPLDDALNTAPLLQADADGTWVTGQRASLDYSVSRDFRMPWGRAEAELISMYRFYELDEALAGYQDSSPQNQANGVRLFSELNFERRAELFGQEWIQSVQPAIQYLNIDAQSQSEIPIFDTRRASPSYSGLFRSNQFVGGDRISDANQVTLGLTSRLIDPVHGNQVARFSIGQAFYLESRKVYANELIQLGLDEPEAYAINDPIYLLAVEREEALSELTRNQSNLITEAEFRLSSEWILTTDTHLNTSSNSIERGHLNFSYLSDDRLSAINLGYRFVEENSNYIDLNEDRLIQSSELFEGNTSQYDLSGLYVINSNWVVMARWQQDLALDRSLEKLIGARYDSCCWSIGLYWRDWLRRDEDVLIPQTELEQDNGIFISFELKGLAGLGQGIENLLEEGIPGYNRETF